MQLATSRQGQPLGRPSITPGAAYVYDLSHRDGLFVGTLYVQDISGEPLNLNDMAESGVCPVATGACISSAGGGDITGYDMYGQLVTETVAAAGTSTIAFAFVTDAPADALWANQFGLPYMYAADAPTPNTDVTIIPPDDAEDARGTFTFGGTFLDEDPPQQTPVEVPYVVDKMNVFGTPYAERYAAGTVGSTPLAVTGTIDDDGLITLAIPAAVLGKPTGFTATFADGHTVRGDLGVTPLTHTLSPLWMSQYAQAIADDADALGRLVAIGFDAAEAKSMYVPLTGEVAAPLSAPTPSSGPMPPPPAPPAPTVPVVPSSFSTHAEADAWLAAYISATGFDEPDVWNGETLTAKRSIAQSLYEHWEADHS